jgi:putative nucleotide binding protein
MEDYVYILDYLPTGRPGHKKGPLAYGIGEKQFTLLELIPKPDAVVGIGERVYVGKDIEKRQKIAKVKGRVNYEDLTSTAHGEIIYVLEDIVRNDQQRFVDFFSDCPAITTRFHALELLPGLGKKTMLEILSERKKGRFASFDDIDERVKTIHSPAKIIAKRILEELENPTEKYRLFTRPPLVKR